MFGNHELEVAERIAREKSIEFNEKCIVLPAWDENGKHLKLNNKPLYTIGRPIKAMTGAEFIRKIRGVRRD